MFHKIKLLSSVLITNFFLCALTAICQVQKATPRSSPIPTASAAGFGKALDFRSNDAPTLISSDSLELDANKRVFEYIGNVHVIQGEMDLVADRVQGSYSELNEIEVLTAIKDVVVQKPDGTKASAQRAAFDAQTQTVVLTESPAIEQNGSILTADKITVYLKEDRSEASGQVRVRLIKKASSEAAATPTPTLSATAAPAAQ